MTVHIQGSVTYDSAHVANLDVASVPCEQLKAKFIFIHLDIEMQSSL